MSAPTGRAAAQAVLWHFGDHVNGLESGSFVTHLLNAFGSADPGNFRALSAAFPDLGTAMHLAQNVMSGMDALREMIRRGSDRFPDVFEAC